MKDIVFSDKVPVALVHKMRNFLVENDYLLNEILQI